MYIGRFLDPLHRFFRNLEKVHVSPGTTPPFRASLGVEELHGLPPIAALAERLRGAETPFLLESGSNPAGMGAWHILGAYPVGEFRAHGRRWFGLLDGVEESGEGNPWQGLEAWWRRWRRAEDPCGTLPFGGGAIGYLGYELGDWEGLSAREDPEPSLPDAHLYLYDELILIDITSERTFLLHRDREGRDQRQWWRRAAPSGREPAVEPLQEQRVSIADGDYLESVQCIRERIERGDFYEVNLSRRHELSGGPSPWQLHRRLRRRQPVPYAALLPWQPMAVVSASPERFLHRRGIHVETRPIKGTVPRGHDEAEDRRAAEELLRSAKERAELAMIIDLERNDLGRVCRAGSVVVAEEAAVERYATVIHTVGTVRGEVAAELSPFDLLRATFPGGSVTGAPKIAVMHAIREYEPVSRKVYTGSVGWISPTGDLDLSIAIRTVLQAHGRTYLSVGGAITWDSDPEQELRELEAKGRAIFSALHGT